jgi:isocitrate dehydrogenase (NAD+)
VDAVVSILDAAGAPFAWERHEGGVAAIAQHNDPLPPKLLESIRSTGSR